MRPIAQQIITDINEGKCIQGVGLRGVIESRVATAEMLMHKNPLGRDNRTRERGPGRSQEQVEILKELATLISLYRIRSELADFMAALRWTRPKVALACIYPQSTFRTARRGRRDVCHLPYDTPLDNTRTNWSRGLCTGREYTLSSIRLASD